VHDLGYVEGKNLIIEWRYAEGQFERLPTFAADLVRLEVEVIVTIFTGAAQAAQGEMIAKEIGYEVWRRDE